MCLSLYRDQDEEEDHIDNFAGVNLKVSVIIQLLYSLILTSSFICRRRRLIFYQQHQTLPQRASVMKLFYLQHYYEIKWQLLVSLVNSGGVLAITGCGLPQLILF